MEVGKGLTCTTFINRNSFGDVLSLWLVLFTLGTLYYALQNGKTALMYASKRGYISCVKRLLQKEADVNFKDNVSCTKAMEYE